jgi:FlaA1/EpsC-like NDP-sugar epimerase
VFISTDKAVRPSSVMGASKRVGEQLVQSLAPPGAAWCAVRFGNVLGSRGSVIPTFMRQIAEGGPVTVTDPRMTRYFMSIEEAVQLVLQAAALANRGDVFVLDMGEPVQIIDLAERMIRLSGRRVGADIRIEVTGTRPGEKLSEELYSGAEECEPTAHAGVTRVRPEQPPASLVETAVRRLQEVASGLRDEAARSLLFDLAWIDSVDSGLIDLTVPSEADRIVSA